MGRSKSFDGRIPMLAKQFSWQTLTPGVLKPRLLNLHAASRPKRWKLRRTVLGLEIRGNALYLACFCPGFRRGELVATEVIPNFAELSAEALHARLRDILQPLKVEEPVVILGLPRRDVIVRLFNLPMVARKSFQEALALQVEMFKPTDTEPFCWDATVVAEGKQQAVSLVLAPTGMVERFANLFDAAGLAVHQLGGADDIASKCRADGLMAEANSQDRRLAGEALNEWDENAGVLRCARAGREHQPLRREGLDLVDCELIIAADDHLRAQFTHILNQVVREGV